VSHEALLPHSAIRVIRAIRGPHLRTPHLPLPITFQAHTPVDIRSPCMSTTTSILNDLIETLKDGEQGFRAAAQDVSSPELRALFEEFAQQRAQFATELHVLAHDKGERNPEEHGSVAGAIHRGWIDLKAALESGDEHAVLAECERGEDAAVNAFREAIDEGELSVDALAVVRRQSGVIKATHDRVRNLRDARRGQ
jgi:uncharacterized protein (TIGR02284 family)